MGVILFQNNAPKIKQRHHNNFELALSDRDKIMVIKFSHNHIFIIKFAFKPTKALHFYKFYTSQVEKLNSCPVYLLAALLFIFTVIKFLSKKIHSPRMKGRISKQILNGFKKQVDPRAAEFDFFCSEQYYST